MPLMIVPPAALPAIEYVVVVIGVTVLFALIAIAVDFPRSPARRRLALQACFVFLSMALIGASAGFIGGLSRVPVAGEIIPAVLGLIGGLSVYTFGTDPSKGTFVAFAAACLAVSVTAGYFIASENRTHTDEFHDLRDKCVAALSNPDLVGNEKALTTFQGLMKDCTASLVWNR